MKLSDIKLCAGWSIEDLRYMIQQVKSTEVILIEEISLVKAVIFKSLSEIS